MRCRAAKPAEREAPFTLLSHLPYSTQGWPFIETSLKGKITGIQDCKALSRRRDIITTDGSRPR